MNKDNKVQKKPEEFPDMAECEPTIILPSKHPITIEMIDKDALFVLKTLSEAGFSGWLVGGGVRDLYLGKIPKDFDISTDARPGQLRKLFKRSTTIGRRFRLVQVFCGASKAIEVSTLRSLSEHDLDGPEAVLAPNNTFGTLSEDARRRDLTINSLFYEIENQTIIDYVHGTEDLQNGIIRVVGDAERRFIHDPVRMMRVIRHATRNSFKIEENCWNALLKSVDKLALCPPSRLRDEFLKDLYSGAIASWFEVAVESGIYSALFPIYAEALTQETTKEQLTAIFRTIDRTNLECQKSGVHRQRDFFLLALTLIPWAEHNFQIISIPRKGAVLFQYSNIIREAIDNSIGQSLNLSRSLRQEVTSLLVHLGQLMHNRLKEKKDETSEITPALWPKWLQRKSYFAKALLFYQFWLEATSGNAYIPAQIEETQQADQPEEKKESRPKRGRRGSRKSSTVKKVEAGETADSEKLIETDNNNTGVISDIEEDIEDIPSPGENAKKNGRSNGKSRSRVAWAPNTPGGVFGLRK
ncbi:polya polymerase [Desulforhopalus vacuolatus]|uniref:polya polymerase n=1 Tax=Desulforhopalus vacuolatus TaxID=40414 RepID=UPI0019625E98|nr:polya polymerase [Desulforhopalus vacuolatus]MBM9521054.1 polya polymerase [Desulforhopalus vacuolatus]